MGIKATLQAEIAERQAKLNIFNTIPEDTYSLGTLALFSGGGSKWYYVKTAEETWKKVDGSNEVRELAEWIYLNKVLAPDLYFEVYIMTPSALPIYASA